MKSKEELIKEIPLTTNTANKINLVIAEALIDIRDILYKFNKRDWKGLGGGR